MNSKQRAAEAAMSFVKDGMVIGLGTGSTADCFLVALAGAVNSGQIKGIRGVPTSRQSERRARELGIPLTSLTQDPVPELAVDGADEIAPNLDLIKGMGGALLREKIVAQASRKFVVIADSSKKVISLGTRSLLPVEVTTFEYQTHEQFFRNCGAVTVDLRRNPDGSVFITDNGNYIYHIRFEAGIGAPHRLQDVLKQRAGIVETGLFLGMATVALVADGDRVEEIPRRS